MKKFILSQFILMLALIPAAYGQQQTAVNIQIAKPAIKKAAKQTEPRFDLFIHTELLFGRNRENGPEISEEEFAEFLAGPVTDAFPDGLTVIDGNGQFRDSDGNIIKEKAKILILFYPLATKRESSRKIESIREAYKKRFDQQSVLRVDDALPVLVSF